MVTRSMAKGRPKRRGADGRGAENAKLTPFDATCLTRPLHLSVTLPAKCRSPALDRVHLPPNVHLGGPSAGEVPLWPQKVALHRKSKSGFSRNVPVTGTPPEV